MSYVLEDSDTLGMFWKEIITWMVLEHTAILLAYEKPILVAIGEHNLLCLTCECCKVILLWRLFFKYASKNVPNISSYYLWNGRIWFFSRAWRLQLILLPLNTPVFWGLEHTVWADVRCDVSDSWLRVLL